MNDKIIKTDYFRIVDSTQFFITENVYLTIFAVTSTKFVIKNWCGNVSLRLKLEKQEINRIKFSAEKESLFEDDTKLKNLSKNRKNFVKLNKTDFLPKKLSETCHNLSEKSLIVKNNRLKPQQRRIQRRFFFIVTIMTQACNYSLSNTPHNRDLMPLTKK